MTKAPDCWFYETNNPALEFLWYLFFENRSAFIRQVCLPHFKLYIKWFCRGSSPQRCVKPAFVINGKIKKFPSWKSPESLDDTAFDAVSSKLADHDGMPDRIRTCDLRSRSYVAVHKSSAFWQVFMYDAQNMAVCKTAMNRCGAMVQSCFLCCG